MERKNGRIASIDIIRGIAIVGMVLCANIGFNSGLPAWMFHAQTPPPTYAFNPEVAGITWVDLVFPFFLFPLGAALPFAMRKRLENGMSRWQVAGSLVKRWLILTLFALVLGNAYAIRGSVQPVWQQDLMFLGIWVAMFLALVQRLGTVINLCGVGLLAVAGVVSAKWFGITPDKGRCDIIIMILANIAIWGGLIWMLTKDNIRLRWLVFLLVAAFKALDSYVPEALSIIPSCDKVSWFFTWDWLQYLLIVIPGSVVGDMILKHSRSGESVQLDSRDVAAGFIALAAVLVQLWGLFTRNVLTDFIISGVLGVFFVALTIKRRNVMTDIGYIGFALMLVGIIFDPIDGGITKDHCNLSYMLTTSGMTALTGAFILALEFRWHIKGRGLSGSGQNPMLAYTVTNFLTGPILALCGILPWLDRISVGSPFWGMFRGLFITLLMVAVTCFFTKKKLFWRS